MSLVLCKATGNGDGKCDIWCRFHHQEYEGAYHTLVLLFFGGVCFLFSSLFEDCRFFYWDINGMSLIKIEFAEDLVDVHRLR